MKYFITYGDNFYAESKARLKRQAESTELFDEVIAYGRSDLSDKLLGSALMNHKKGGGLWCWKPDIILKTLEKANYDDIVVYADSGCTVLGNKEWTKYFNILSEHEMLCFHLGVLNLQYCKKDALIFFDTNAKKWINNFQISATVILFKKTANTLDFVREWQSIMLNNPSLVIDVEPDKKDMEHSEFIGHRHDQSIFSGLVYKYHSDYSIKIIQNHFEGHHLKFFGQAIIATRIADTVSRSDQKKSMFTSIVHYLIVRPLRNFAFNLRLRF